jgi:periplasmic protein TonB
MSRLSIYENPWLDIVFENKNKNYGAYQLRHESVKSSITALFMGLLFVASIGTIVALVSHYNPVISPVEIIDESPTIVQLSDIKPHTIVQPETPQIPQQTVKQDLKEPIINDVLKNPIIVAAVDANPNIATNEEMKNTSTVTDGTATTGLSATSGTGTGTGVGTEVSNSGDNGNAIENTSMLDKLPEFPGGMKKFYTYVGNNFEKPEIDGLNTLKVYVGFVIERDGSMSNIKVLRDPGYGLGDEAVRVLKSLKTKWTPGIINSKPVRTAYNLPISIELR